MTREEQIERLDAAIEECKIAQFRPKEHQYLKNPITEQELILNTTRSKRHFETKRDGGKAGITPVQECMYCNFETTPTLFYVNWGGEIVFPDHQEIVARIKEYLGYKENFEEGNGEVLNKIDTYYNLARAVAPWNRLEEDWLCRVFFNLTPSIVQKNGKGNCFMIAGSPAFHYCEIPDLPTAGLKAMIDSMKLLADWSKKNNLVFNPFCNGGKSLASGQSVDCFHFQAYALPEVPPFYKQLKERWRDGDCPVCRVLKEAVLKYSSQSDCFISQEGTFGIYVHPYPEYNFTWLIAEKECQPRTGPKKFNQIDSQALARTLKKAVILYPLLFETMPAYNILFRLPENIGHFHVEIIPRTNTNIIAGCELSTKTIVITQDPRDVADELKKRLKTKKMK